MDQVSRKKRPALPGHGDQQDPVAVRPGRRARAAAHGHRHRQDIHGLPAGLEAAERQGPQARARSLPHRPQQPQGPGLPCLRAPSRLPSACRSTRTPLPRASTWSARSSSPTTRTSTRNSTARRSTSTTTRTSSIWSSSTSATAPGSATGSACWSTSAAPSSLA